MNPGNILPIVTTLVAALIVSFSTTRTAVAQQNPNCCTCSIDIAVDPLCLPISIWSTWSNGSPGPVVINANGIYTFPIPTPPSCPPAANLLGVSLAGASGPFASYNNPVFFTVNGYCLVARITYDGGCPVLYIRPC